MHAKGLSGSSVSCAVGKRPGQDSMRARVEAAAIASENDGLSPPSAGSCRCPRPKRGDGFASVSHCVVDEWCVVCMCSVRLRLFAHCRANVEVQLGDRSVSSVRVMARVGKWSCSRATPSDRGTGHWLDWGRSGLARSA